MRYRLRTLLILLAVGPPLVAWYCWPAIKTWLAKKPLPTPTIVATSAKNNVPYFVVYSTGKYDPKMVENVVRTLLTGGPEATMRVDDMGRLVVLAPSSVHKTVQAIMVEFERSAALENKNN